MEDHSAAMNRFLVEVFDAILKTEAVCLASDELSLRELHLIEEICRAVDEGGDNRSTAIAAAQQVTAGTLTSAVNLLEKKGYLLRQRDAYDKRVVRLVPTQRARTANARHTAFHQKMVESILSSLTEEEAGIFVRSLGKLTEFFRTECPVLHPQESVLPNE